MHLEACLTKYLDFGLKDTAFERDLMPHSTASKIFA